MFAFLVSLFPSALSAQDIHLIKRFTTLNGTVDFLPGAWVNVWEDGHSSYYRYTHGKFSPALALPRILRGWESFDWSNGADTADKLITEDYDPGVKSFLPKDARVKKVLDLPLGPKGVHLLLVCFTTKYVAPWAEPYETNISVTALIETRPGEKCTAGGCTYDSSRISFKRLWSRRVETDAFYAAFEVQEVYGLGRFVLLYWADAACATCFNPGLDVFRLTE